MKNRITTAAIAVLAIVLVGISACKKEEVKTAYNEEQQRKIDSLSLIVATDSLKQNLAKGNINYTVQVVSGSGLTSGKTDGATGASVYANQNGNITKVTTDESGLAPFKLQPGNVAVTVILTDHTTLNYVVELTAGGSGESYASTIATLFPLNGAGTATISGAVFANLDETNATLENAPAGTTITAYLDETQLLSYVNHSQSGRLIKVAYEKTNFTTQVTNGRYSLNVPATADGLIIRVKPNDFEFNVAQTGGTNTRKVFKSTGFNSTVQAAQTVIQDVSY